MIKITNEYRIDPNRDSWAILRHCCLAPMDNYSSEKWGYSIPIGRCVHCSKETPQKIQFIFNLWKLHNDKNY